MLARVHNAIGAVVDEIEVVRTPLLHLEAQFIENPQPARIWATISLDTHKARAALSVKRRLRTGRSHGRHRTSEAAMARLVQLRFSTGVRIAKLSGGRISVALVHAASRR